MTDVWGGDSVIPLIQTRSMSELLRPFSKIGSVHDLFPKDSAGRFIKIFFSRCVMLVNASQTILINAPAPERRRKKKKKNNLRGKTW